MLAPRVLQLLVLLVVPVAGMAGAGSEQEALDWLGKMSRAGQTLNYQGTFVYREGGQLESMQIVHRANGGREQERLVHLNGAAREVVRDNDTVICILPDDNVVFVERRYSGRYLSPLLVGKLETVATHYRFSTGGNQRVAGRSAVLLVLQPKDGYRYGYHLWVDADTALLLRSDLLDGQGKVIEQLMFTELKVVDNIPAGLLQPSVDARNYTWYRHDAPGEAQPEQGARWSVRQMPPGFFVAEYYKRKLSPEGQVVDHLLISDGLATVSVFVERVSGGLKTQRRKGAVAMGAINLYAAAANGHQVTVVGEVPPATVRMIAESVAAGSGRR